ncbi:MAG: inorganic phosphate transporter [Longicatena sp.]
MSITFMDFIDALTTHPLLMLITALMLGVMVVNGWSDAPNAIATCISTRAIRVKNAVRLAVVCNLLGVFVMTSINVTVAQTIYNMVDFGKSTDDALVALCASLVAIMVWAIMAWKIKIPTSESHALIAGLSGAAIAFHNGLQGINGSEWQKVIFGFGASLWIGFVGGFLFVKIIERICRNCNRKKSQTFFRYGSIMGGAMMAFMHGAQSGQKFMGVFLISIFMVNGNAHTGGIEIPIWLMCICSIAIGLGTSIGGYKIIKAVGMDLVKLEKYQGFASDMAASIYLFASSWLGLPVSTTHTRSSSVMGAGSARRLSSVDWKYVKKMLLVWVLTFPCAGFLGFLFTKLFILLF